MRVTVDGSSWCGYFSVVKLKGLRLYGHACKHRRTANRQARRIGKALGCEVVINKGGA